MSDPSGPGPTDDEDGVGLSTPDSPQRDDAGRADDDAGFATQARIFAAVALWMVFASLVYGLLTSEWAGTTMLAVAGLLVFTIAAYVGWAGPTSGTSVDAEEPDHEAEEPWFPVASGWPITLALGIVLLGNGLLLGQWLVVPAVAVIAFALAGFVVQSRVRG
ncbi:MAG: hypothetical protein JWO77_2862 [Ilumatobacteraceae bacterium]|nr:hypothetical protein [Ilumatobacteraceae bacterium]